MAAPITHIVLAEKVFEEHFADKDKAKFIIGTSFPDIRYLGIIEREKTHPEIKNLEEIKSEDSFTAGLKLHGLVDILQMQFLEKNLYENGNSLPHDYHTIFAIKYIGDLLLYDKISDWDTIQKYFDKTIEQEIEFGVSGEYAKEWHIALQSLMKRNPDQKTALTFARKMHLSEEDINKLQTAIDQIANNTKVAETTISFYEKFPTLLVNYNKL